jgi:hypothetical protein
LPTHPAKATAKSDARTEIPESRTHLIMVEFIRTSHKKNANQIPNGGGS